MSQAWGQNRRTNTNAAQAVLHIQATVVPFVNLSFVYPRDDRSNPKDVTYNLPISGQRVTVTDEIRPLLATDGIPGARGMLKTTTVVSQ